ncbi:integrase, catalytic region, zinc finger, CCHC-type containing protein [Tanacetum coccineum]|uniref:Integrase, catalytic region, zinc finger, CCHC-type containing protein n=1 Tax=Tanacetum coccineum TaxID=301880 RepID=A0ABQ5C824_9ASTR
MDESIHWDQKCKSSKELFKIKKCVGTIFDGVERCKQTIAKRTYFGNIDPFIQNTIEGNFGPQISKLNADLEQFHLCLKEEMVADLRYFNSLEHEVDTLKSQLETQKTQFLNEIDRLSREYYYADHMNAILGIYTDLDEFTDLQCDYGETLEKCERLEKELSKSRTMSKSFESLQKHAINLELDLQQCKEKIKNDKSFKENQSNVFLKEREQYFEIQDLKAQLQDKGIAISELKKLIEKMKGKSVETKFEKSSVIRQHEKLLKVKDIHFRCIKPLGKPNKLVTISTGVIPLLELQTTAKSNHLEDRVHLVEIILFIIDSGCSKHMTGNLKLLTNFVEKFLGTVKFGNDQIAPILGYGDLVQGTITIKRVYYVEGFNHNLFSIGQFCDADLEVAFRKSTCYIRDLKGNDLLTGSRGTDLYSITLQDSTTPNPICLMAKATSSKDETPGVLIDFLTLVQRGLHAQVTTVRTDKGTEFLNKTLHAYFAKEGIRHETSTARTPEQNGVVERRNRTLVEAARTMLSAAKVPLFFWAEAIATACFTQNRSLVIPRHEKTPYHIINARKPSVKFFHIFGSLCYIVRDGENLDKMKEKGDACIFVGYSTQSKAYRVFNKRTRMIVETIHVNFDELPQMASDHVSSDPGPQCSTTVLEQDSLSPGPQSQENVPQVAETVTTSNELELLYSPMFSELLNGRTYHVCVSKSSAVLC